MKKSHFFHALEKISQRCDFQILWDKILNRISFYSFFSKIQITITMLRKENVNFHFFYLTFIMKNVNDTSILPTYIVERGTNNNKKIWKLMHAWKNPFESSCWKKFKPKIVPRKQRVETFFLSFTICAIPRVDMKIMDNILYGVTKVGEIYDLLPSDVEKNREEEKRTWKIVLTDISRVRLCRISDLYYIERPAIGYHRK